jgi:hypothetical protein
MHDLRDRLVEVAEAAAAATGVPGSEAAIRRGRRRRRHLVGGLVLAVALLAGGIVPAGRLVGVVTQRDAVAGGPAGPSCGTLPPFPGPIGSGMLVELVGCVRTVAEGKFGALDWRLSVWRQRWTPQRGARPQLQICSRLQHTQTCLPVAELLRRRTAGFSLAEPIQNTLFAYTGWVPTQASRVRIQVDDQPPFDAQRIVDPGPQILGGRRLFVAFFSPKGGTDTMLHARVKFTVLDGAGRRLS